MPFSERTQKDLSGALKCFGSTVANVLLSSAKKTKNEAFFGILVTITLGVNMITRKTMPFLIYSSTSISWYLLFWHLKTFTIQSPLCILFCSVKYIFIYMPKMPLSSVLTWISFYTKKFANFWYII